MNIKRFSGYLTWNNLAYLDYMHIYISKDDDGVDIVEESKMDILYKVYSHINNSCVITSRKCANYNNDNTQVIVFSNCPFGVFIG